MKNSLISIIIPLYNAAGFINKAYDYITRQTVELPLEIIFVDNNSKDNSYELALTLAEQDKRVKVFKERKQGAPAARNAGFKKSSGDFIYFYDVDDQLFNYTLASLLEVLLSTPKADAVFGKMIKSYKNVASLDLSSLNDSGKVTLESPPYWGLKWFRDLSSVVGPPAFMYRRETFEKLGMYNEAIPASEDTALDIDLGMDYKVAFIDKTVYLYYKHEEATTSLLKKQKLREEMQWPRLTMAHIPYALNNPQHQEYRKILDRKIFNSLARLVTLKDNFSGRKKDFLNYKKDIAPLPIPIIIKLYLKLLVLFPHENLIKIFKYYYLPFFLK